MNIGYTNPGYPVVRTILNKCDNVSYTRIRPFSSVLSSIALKLHRSRLASDLIFSYFGGLNSRNIDLFHFFNVIPLTCVKKPFITTFETTVPRFFKKGWMYDNALKSIESNRCKKLLALSECTKRLQSNLFIELGLEYLSDKIAVLHPPQDILTTQGEIESKEVFNKEIVFIFVGRAFWHKGGGEAVRALQRIRREYPVRLKIIGNINYRDYMDNPKKDDSNEMHRIIDANKDWIEYFPSLPNKDVLQIIKEADIGLLPTRGDTYGYSVLEMQSAGLPCITTDLRALPEINNDSCGWLIKIPKDRNYNAIFQTQDDKDYLCDTIENQLVEICTSIVNNAAQMKEKSLKAFQRIIAVHDPIVYGEILKEIYQSV